MSARPTVVFLHGLARGPRSFRTLEQAVTQAGFETWAADYPSRSRGLEALAEGLHQTMAARFGNTPLVAVTHSMGGIVLRLMHEGLNFQGAVMIAPPNQGSAVARALKPRWWFQKFFGPSGLELAHGDTWPAPPSPFVVVAGTGGRHWASPPSWHNHRILGDRSHDGTVGVEETKLEGMAAFHEVPRNHTFILDAPETRDAVLRFLTPFQTSSIRTR